MPTTCPRLLIDPATLNVNAPPSVPRSCMTRRTSQMSDAAEIKQCGRARRPSERRVAKLQPAAIDHTRRRARRRARKEVDDSLAAFCASARAQRLTPVSKARCAEPL
jgi:hypothetical protein